MNSDHQLHDTEPLDNPNGGLHHRDNVTIRSGSAGSNGSNTNGNNHSSSQHGTPTRSTTNNKRKIKKAVGFWDRVNHHYLRRTTRSINNSNYAKYGKKKRSRHNVDKLQTLLFWGVVCMVSFVFGFAWKHFTTSVGNGHNIHPQLRHTADNKVPSNPYAKLNEQQKQQHKTQHYNTNNNYNKQQQHQANINSLVIPRFDTRQYMNSKNQQHPQSVLLEGWNHPFAFRSFPYAKQTHGPIIKNIDSDYGGLSYHSLRNEDVFARVILPADNDNDSLSDGDNVIIGAFDPDNIDTTSTALKSRNRKRKRTTGSYPQYKSDGTKVLNDETNQAELTSYYNDDSVTILPKSNDYKKGQPRACKKPEFAYNYFPSCNAFHEHNLGRVYDDPADIVHPRPEHETYKKYLAHGFYRDVWIMEDSPWIWPQQYTKEKEYIQTQTFGVEDEKRTNEMIPKAYRSTALKTFQMKHPFTDEHWEEVQLEAIIMESMTKSPRIMDLYGHCGFSTMVEVVPIEFEEVIVPGEGYQDPDTVEQRNKNGLRPYNDFTSDEKLGYALEMAESLADLHGFELGVIVHDDVQPCQWLHTPDRKMLKLGDFNRATIMQWDMVKNEYCKFNNGPAFANYRAPEEFAARNLNEQIDTWSFGNNIYAMITGLWNFVSMHCVVVLSSMSMDSVF